MTIPRKLKKLEIVFSKYIRLRDARNSLGGSDFARCCTCGEVSHITNLQAGHFIPGRRGTGKAAFDERNCHAQCSLCNYNDKDVEYFHYMQSTYSMEVIKELRDMSKDMSFSYTRSWLDEMTAHYKAKLKELE